jgi:hypothetical protein
LLRNFQEDPSPFNQRIKTMQDFPHLPIKAYEDLRSEIRSGDILLCSGTSPGSNLIQKATQSMWSHVGFILRLDVIDRIMILESVESIGVRAVPLSSYVKDYNGSRKGYSGPILLARHDDVKQNHIINLSRHAVDLLGYPYNAQEILHIATRISMSALGVKSAPDEKPSREFICSEYAAVCFESIGVNIDYNPLGFIAPVDFARCPKVQGISFIRTENSSITASANTGAAIEA